MWYTCSVHMILEFSSLILFLFKAAAHPTSLVVLHTDLLNLSAAI